MSDNFVAQQVIVRNAQGLHARPAHAFVMLAKQYAAEIEVEKDGERVDGKSILSILTLVAVQGTRLVIRAAGEDASEAVAALAQLFERNFDEDDAGQPLGERTTFDAGGMP